MRLIPAQEFLTWASGRGIGLDERYPKSGGFTCRASPDSWWDLEAPAETVRLLPFISDALDALGPWQQCTAWHRKGAWPGCREMEDPAACLYSFLLGGAGIPFGLDGAIAFDRSERASVIAVAAASLLFGRTVSEDVILFPDHGKFFLECGHHQDMTVSIFDSSLMEPFDQYMRDRGHEVAEE